MIYANDYLTIDAALDAAQEANRDLVFPGQVYSTDGFRLRPGVRMVADGRPVIQWRGGPGTLARSLPDQILHGSEILGLTFDSNDATVAIDWRSALDCVLRDVLVMSSSSTQVVLNMMPNASGEANEWGNRNVAFNRVDNLRQRGVCGSVVRMDGIGPVNGPPTAVTTLNTFTALSAAGVAGRGIDFAAWADTNRFEGFTYINLVAPGAVGVEHNSRLPSGNMGVYSNGMAHLAVDCWGSMPGRVGVRMGYCKSTRIEQYENNPKAEGGDLIVGAQATGYFVRKVALDGMFVEVQSPPVPAVVGGWVVDTNLRANLKQRGIIS